VKKKQGETSHPQGVGKKRVATCMIAGKGSRTDEKQKGHKRGKGGIASTDKRHEIVRRRPEKKTKGKKQVLLKKRGDHRHRKKTRGGGGGDGDQGEKKKEKQNKREELWGGGKNSMTGDSHRIKDGKR